MPWWLIVLTHVLSALLGFSWCWVRQLRLRVLVASHLLDAIRKGHIRHAVIYLEMLRGNASPAEVRREIDRPRIVRERRRTRHHEDQAGDDA